MKGFDPKEPLLDPEAWWCVSCNDARARTVFLIRDVEGGEETLHFPVCGTCACLPPTEVLRRLEKLAASESEP